MKIHIFFEAETQAVNTMKRMSSEGMSTAVDQLIGETKKIKQKSMK